MITVTKTKGKQRKIDFCLFGAINSTVYCVLQVRHRGEGTLLKSTCSAPSVPVPCPQNYHSIEKHLSGLRVKPVRSVKHNIVATQVATHVPDLGNQHSSGPSRIRFLISPMVSA